LLFSPCRRSSLYRAYLFLQGHFPHDDEVGHLRRYSLKELSQICETAGLVATRRVYVDGPWRDWVILFRPLNRLYPFLGRRYVRTVFNQLDYYLAQVMFPGAVCVHAMKGGGGTGGRV
jgi:hypothetical protein